MKRFDREIVHPEIIYFDNHILVLDKPASWLTQAVEDKERSLEDFAKKWLKEQFQKKGAVFTQPIHRLDRSASGLVVFAKTSKALQRLQEAQRERLFKKNYLTLVEGEFPQEKGSLIDFLSHGDFRAKEDPSGKKCELDFRVLKIDGGYTLLSVLLKSGRYHQIRAQFSMRGFPIVGDFKYGSRLSFFPGEIALRHFKMQLIHPVTQKEHLFQAPWPQHWSDYSFFHSFCTYPTD